MLLKYTRSRILRVRHITTAPSRQLHESIMMASIMYAETNNLTVALQYSIQGIQSLGVPWGAAFFLSGLIFRAATLPLHIYAEKLSAQRFHAVQVIHMELLKKFSKHYNINVVMSDDGQRVKLNTNDKDIIKKTNKMTHDVVVQVCRKHRLQLGRIQYLRLSAIPVWTFSSFAIRNMMRSGVGGHNYGNFLWIPDIIEADPYCILPIAVGTLGLFNFFAQRRIYSFTANKFTPYINGIFTTVVIVSIYFMSELPACIPIFWSAVSLSGAMQYLAFRHPKVKQLYGIEALPTDSSTPIRDLLFYRKKIKTQSTT